MYSTSRLYHTISNCPHFNAIGILNLKVLCSITSKRLLKNSEVVSVGTLNMALPN